MIPKPRENSDALESDCASLIPESYEEREEVSEITGIYAERITESYIDGQPDAQDIEPASDPTLPEPPPIADDHLGEDLHNVPHSRSLDNSIPHSRSLDLSNPPIEDAEIIGIDVDVCPYTIEATPLVAEKASGENPTPSDIETPPVNGTGE